MDQEKEQKHKPSIEQIIRERKEHLHPSLSIFYEEKPFKIISSQGQYLFTEDGQKILDCCSNVSHIGHCHPYFVKKVQEQTSKLIINTRFIYEQLTFTAKKLLKKFPPQLSVITFLNSGSEANDLALQMAELYTRKKGVICVDQSYHGATKSCLQVSTVKWSDKFKQPPHVKTAKFPCSYRGCLVDKENSEEYLDEIKQLVNEDTGAFICQFMLGVGQVCPPKNHYKEIIKFLKEKNVVCIADEVQAGFGRIGSHFWTFEYYDVLPDIVTLGKPMGNGLPVAAVVTTKEIAQAFKERGLEFFSSFGGNPVSMAAINAVLDVMEEEKLQENAKLVGDYLLENLNLIKKECPYIGDVRGHGFFIGIDFVTDRESKTRNQDLAKKISIKLRQKSIAINKDGNVLKFKPPMVFDMKNADEFLTAFRQIIKEETN